MNSVAASVKPGAAHGITASLDEIRLYGNVLSDEQILALTHLGQAGR